METRLLKASLVALTTAAISPLAAQAVQGIVVDGAGVELGALQGGAVFVRLDDGTIVQFPLRPVTVVENSGKTWLDATHMLPATGWERLYFPELNCVGAPHVTYDGSRAIGAAPSAVVADEDGKATLYVGKLSFPAYRKMASVMDSGHVCNNSGLKVKSVPVIRTIDMSNLYQVPYSLK